MVVKSESVMGEILRKLPCEPPEIGGILGGKNGVVTCHVLDYGKTGGSPCSYTPNIAYLNRKIEEWFKDGIEFMGIFHVHFGGAESLSPGDKLYIGQILAGNGGLSGIERSWENQNRKRANLISGRN